MSARADRDALGCACYGYNHKDRYERYVLSWEVFGADQKALPRVVQYSITPCSSAHRVEGIASRGMLEMSRAAAVQQQTEIEQRVAAVHQQTETEHRVAAVRHRGVCKRRAESSNAV
eukprot:1160437-Pelagomonas_calceolata.AAC.10